jgi:hypothetical protein
MIDYFFTPRFPHICRMRRYDRIIIFGDGRCVIGIGSGRRGGTGIGVVSRGTCVSGIRFINYSDRSVIGSERRSVGSGRRSFGTGSGIDRGQRIMPGSVIGSGRSGIGTGSGRTRRSIGTGRGQRIMPGPGMGIEHSVIGTGSGVVRRMPGTPIIQITKGL